jgi:PAS domain S-box-containing protein
MLKFAINWPPTLIPRSVVLLISGMGVMIVTDLIVDYRTGHELAGSLVPEVGWTAANALIGLAGIWRAIATDSTWALNIAQVRYKSSNWLHYTPILWVVVGYFLLVWNRVHPLPIDPSLLEWGMGGIVVMGMLRQLLVMRENVHLQTLAQRELAERARAEAALRDSEMRLRRITDNMLDVITEIGLDGTIHYASPSHLWILGSEAGLMMGESVLDRLHPDDAAEAVERLFEFAAERVNPGPIAYRYQHADGHYLWMECIANLIINAHDEVEGVVLCSRDVTKRTDAEEAQRRLNDELAKANRRLQELDEMKDQFVSNVSHELRTPHANIKLYLQLLERGKPEKRAEYMQTLRREVARLETMIDELLDLSRLDRGAVRFEMTPTNLNELLHQLVTDRTSLAVQRGLTLDFQPGGSLPPASADPAGLIQISSNLITNAMNYTPTGGSVTICTAVSQRGDSNWVTFTVKDTGPGISAHDLPHIFERFYRGEVGRKATAPGTGLGLAISREIVTRLDGDITIESAPGQGAAFTVWLKQVA